MNIDSQLLSSTLERQTAENLSVDFWMGRASALHDSLQSMLNDKNLTLKKICQELTALSVKADMMARLIHGLDAKYDAAGRLISTLSESDKRWNMQMQHKRKAVG